MKRIEKVRLIYKVLHLLCAFAFISVELGKIVMDIYFSKYILKLITFVQVKSV